MSEKMTDSLMMNAYKSVFGHIYETSNNKTLFDALIPDGYDIINNNSNDNNDSDNQILIIIENKKSFTLKSQAIKQLKKYKSCVTNNYKNVYCIFGYGTNENDFGYVIFDNELKETKLLLNDLYKLVCANTSPLILQKQQQQSIATFNLDEIHKLNSYMYNNEINLPKSQKTLFIAFLLIGLKLNPDLLQTNSTSKTVLTESILQLMDAEYSDTAFIDNFRFIRKDIHNKHIRHMLSILHTQIDKFGVDVLNKFYSEFCLWDKNNDSKFGVVLTPPDIVELMINELNITNTDYVLDFCTGTGSFLIEASKYTHNLFGCENNSERYSLAKCNFILNDLDYTKLHYESCFNVVDYKTNMFDKIVINLPFNCRCSDMLNSNNTVDWQSESRERKFIMYAVELLKPNGLAAIIVPRSNFNNNNKSVNKFKSKLLEHCDILKIYCLNSDVFQPNASVACSIIVIRKRKSNDNENTTPITIIDYTNDGFECFKNKRIKRDEPKPNVQERIIGANDDWNYIDDKPYELTKDELLRIIRTYNINYLTTYLNKLMMNNEPLPTKFKYPIDERLFNNNDFDELDIGEYKIGDYFSAVVVGKENTKIIKNVEPGEYPLLSSTGENNGVATYINTYDFDLECLSVARNGTTGATFYQKGKFSRTTDIILLLFDNEYEHAEELYKVFALFMNVQLRNKYSWSNKLSIEKLMNETVKIPNIMLDELWDE